MGMFDDLRCDYPLPAKDANALSFQTKDTPAQYCELYIITEDGRLLHDEGGTLDPCSFTGEIVFYTFLHDSFDRRDPGAWVEFSSYFVKGQLKEVHLISDTREERAAAMAGLPPDTRTQKEKWDDMFAPSTATPKE